ncbi:hypothetical protein ACOBR2_12765 [Telmatobacter bradus]|uniref:hypothetical protein n=1 Tax=Telmatobacter bradus TaxID=474953 RepID=UPI003B42876C
MQTRKSPKHATCDTECIACSHQTSLVLEEEGIAATFANPRRKELRVVRYDKCYFKSKGKQADYIVGSDQTIDVILELKGSDLKHARVQMEETLARWRVDPIHYPSIVCLIVYGHTFPRMRSNIGAIEYDFLTKQKTLLWIRENGKEKFSFRKLAGRR